MASVNFHIATRGALAEVRQRLILTAKTEHAKVMRTEPRPRTFTRFVDGRRGLPEESVRANGVITYRYPRLEEVVRYAMDMLFKYSPVLSGAYRKGHTIFVNGRPVANLSGLQDTDQIIISNILPYARKIDVGAMKMRVAGTDRTYQRAVAATNRRHGRIYRALYTWRSASDGVLGENSASEIRYPAILFREADHA